MRGRRKADINIGLRTVEELYRKFPDMNDIDICRRLGMERKNFYEWKTGNNPGTFALQRICYAGCDVKYILTGIRSVNNG